MILFKIQKLNKDNNVDLTGKPQHGFKPKHSTTTASIILQSLLVRATNDDMYAMMASLDLSAAFDVVNVERLIKRLMIIGLPVDLIDLVRNWLMTRYLYVTSASILVLTSRTLAQFRAQFWASYCMQSLSSHC